MPKLPTAQEVGAHIYTLVHNSGPGAVLSLSDQEVRELAGRKRLHVSVRDGINSHITSLEGEAIRTNGVTDFRIPSESIRLTLEEAMGLNREAQETGVRSTPAHSDTVVIKI